MVRPKFRPHRYRHRLVGRLVKRLPLPMDKSDSGKHARKLRQMLPHLTEFRAASQAASKTVFVIAWTVITILRLMRPPRLTQQVRKLRPQVRQDAN